MAVDGLNANPNTKAKFSLNFSADLTEREFSDFLGVLPPRNNRGLNDTDAEILVESEDRRSLEAPSG